VVAQTYLDAVSAADRESRWRDRLASGARRIVLAEIGSVVVGVVSWGLTDVEDAPALELKSLYVAADQRGSGLAARLIHEALGTSSAHLWVFRGQPAGSEVLRQARLRLRRPPQDRSRHGAVGTAVRPPECQR
jgi:GNAT superfamily N-acetyltransferase